MDPAQAQPRALEAPDFIDGLGEREVVTDAASGESVQVLRLRSALTSVPSFEFALRERTARLANFRQNAFARVRRVDRSPMALSIVSDEVDGFRLSQMLRIAEERRFAVDVNAALSLISQALPAIVLLHENARDVAHGAIGPDRLIVTPHARLVVAEYVLGSALEQLHLSHDRLWRDYRIPMPPSAGAPRFDHRADVMQLGVTSLSLFLGRVLRDDELACINELLAESTETSAGGARQPLSQGLRGWLARALQLDQRRPFLTAREAQMALEQVLTADPRYVASPVAVEAFITRCVDSIIDVDGGLPVSGIPDVEPVVAFQAPGLTLPVPPVAPLASAPPVAPIAPAPAAAIPPSAPIAREPARPAPPAPAAIPPVVPAASILRQTAPEVGDTATTASGVPATPPPRREPPPATSTPVAPVVHAPPPPPFAPTAPVEHPEYFVPAPPAPRAAVVPPAPVEPRVARPEIDFQTFPTPYSHAAPFVEERPEIRAPQFESASPRERSSGRALRLIVVFLALAGLAGAGVFVSKRYVNAPATTTVETGTLVVQSAPSGIEVVVDGETRGVTPLRVPLKVGAHILELRGRGLPRVMPITMTAGATLQQFVEFADAAAPSSGQLDVRSTPPGARVTVDGQQVGTAPMTVANLAPGEHTVVLERDGATVRHMVTIEAGVTASLVAPVAAAPAGPASGWVAFSAPFAMQIFEGGRLVGSTESDRIMVPAGRHQFEIVNETLGYRVTRVAQVQPGRTATIGIELPNGLVNLNALPWAEVWIDDRRVGETPIGNLSLPIGPHEIVFRHPQFGEKRQAISVTPSNPVRVSVDMRK